MKQEKVCLISLLFFWNILPSYTYHQVVSHIRDLSIDLELALALDPENKSVLEELAKLPEPVKESDAEALATMEVVSSQCRCFYTELQMSWTDFSELQR